MISKATAEHYVWGQNCDGWHLVKRDDLSIIHERMPVGTAEVRHYHQVARQFFFILSGTATLDVNGQLETLTVGQGVEVPPQTPHHIFNPADQPVEFLVISHPTTRGDRIAVPANAAG